MTTLEKLRSVKVGPFAVFDFASAAAGMYFIAPHIGISRERALWLTVPIGIATHAAFGTQTPLNKMVLGPEPSRLAQAAVALMLVKGLT